MSSKAEKGDCCCDPWPQLLMACARVVEIYSKIFDRPELMKISKSLRSTCKTCTCKTKGVDHEFEVRQDELLKQNPMQDEMIESCKFLDFSSRKAFADFVRVRNEFASGKVVVESSETDGKLCTGCKEIIPPNALFISNKSKDLSFHPNCFKCSDCQEFLQDLRFCLHEDLLFCNRHYGEKIRPRCSTCDELIFEETCTKAMGRNWHTNHFWCKNCNLILTGKKFAQKDNSPFCLKCYESCFGNSCQKCEKTVGVDAKYLIYKKKHWHETCFTCRLCQKSLVDKEFVSKQDDVYCETCHEEKLAPRCQTCEKPFKFGMKSIEYKSNQFHEECFKCLQCQTPITTKKFAAKEGKIFCDHCYQEKFGAKCTKCKKTIFRNGITYKNEPWHKECFSCTNCPVLLSGKTFTSRDDKPFCVDCFGTLFAKKCFACREPINGEGAKFVNYDNHHWHDNCFFCSDCRCNLGGKRFIMGGDVILCPVCARKNTKLMGFN